MLEDEDDFVNYPYADFGNTSDEDFEMDEAPYEATESEK